MFPHSGWGEPYWFGLFFIEVKNAHPNKNLFSVVEAIGQTPLVELSRITLGLSGRLFAKLEFFNPGFSKKDRIAKQIIEDGEKDGSLQPGQPVVELTSGNTGTGLAIVCGVKGYPLTIVMSEGNSPERAKMMKALGAEVVLVPQLPNSKKGQVSGPDLELVEKKTQKLVQEKKAFRADQFHHPGNFRAHYLHTGPEIFEQMPVPLDGFCDFVGSGGTFGGCAKFFKEQNPEIRCFVVEPSSAPALAGKKITNPAHKIQGGGYSFADLDFIDPNAVDGFVEISDSEAVEATRALSLKEGLFAGFSSGANVAAALKLLKGEMAGKNLAIMLNDSGLKYLSTDLWE